MQMTLYVVYKDRKQQILPAAVVETKCGDHIIKDVDHQSQLQENSSETQPNNKRDLEIVVLDYGEQVVHGVVVLQPNHLPWNFINRPYIDARSTSS